LLHVAEQSYRTDTGRQRTANEDSYFASAPLFAVADGMGGAQAGEVASRIAAEAFEPAERGSDPPEAFLRQIAQEANRQIHGLAQHDSTRSGMGTTLTSALLEGDELALGHVGDSRAYRFRDDELTLLTSDHSLVEELRRQGRLTDEQAEDHPQRSIITRALGPEPEVEVDTMTFRARSGDVYLLCSDGLTTMLKEPRIAEILRDSESLDDATARLVSEANEAGGRDNITVIAFRVEEEGEPAETDPHATLVGPAAAEAGLTGERVQAEASAERRRAALGGAASDREAAPVAAKRSRGRRALKALVVLAIVAALAVAAVLGARQVYFLGTDEGGRLALYRGLPYDLPLGVELYSEVYSIPTRVDGLPEDRRDEATNHELRSRDDAVDLLENLEDAAADEATVTPDGSPGPAGGDGGQNQGGGNSASGDSANRQNAR
jgi:PPM family protein phosphatase